MMHAIFNPEFGKMHVFWYGLHLSIFPVLLHTHTLMMQVGKNVPVKYIFQQGNLMVISSDHNNKLLCFIKGWQSNFSRVSLFQHTTECLLAKNLKSNCDKHLLRQSCDPSTPPAASQYHHQDVHRAWCSDYWNVAVHSQTFSSQIKIKRNIERLVQH